MSYQIELQSGSLFGLQKQLCSKTKFPALFIPQCSFLQHKAYICQSRNRTEHRIMQRLALCILFGSPLIAIGLAKQVLQLMLMLRTQL